MEAAAIALPMVAGGVGAIGSLLEGDDAEKMAKYEARQLQIKADEEMGLASVEAKEKLRESKLANSRNLAVAAAGGGGAADPTVLQVMGDVEAEGVKNSLIELYKGESRKRDLLEQAKMTKKAGKSAKTSSRFGAAGSLLEGVIGGLGKMK